jgi:hypothetical protein
MPKPNMPDEGRRGTLRTILDRYRSQGRTATPTAGRRARRWRAIGFGIAAAALLLTEPADAGAADLLRLRCINPASGASWTIVIDLDRDRVGSLPAKITDAWISWHDPQRGFFDLDRATLGLRFRNASSTGGYFLHYACQKAS